MIEHGGRRRGPARRAAAPAAAGPHRPVDSDARLASRARRVPKLCRSAPGCPAADLHADAHARQEPTPMVFLPLLEATSSASWRRKADVCRQGQPPHRPPQRLRPRPAPEPPVRPTRRLHATSCCATPSAIASRHFWAKLDTSSLEKYADVLRAVPQAASTRRSSASCPRRPMPLNPRTRLIYDEPKWTGYEVTLDLYPDVFAYGILLLPKDLKPGEKRPVVVCQHGLEGRPTDVCNPKEKTPVLQLLRRPARRSRLHRLRAAEPVHRPGQLPRPPAQGQPARAVALLVHRPPARAHPRLAGDAAARRSRRGSPSTACPTAARRPCACRPLLPRYCLSICSGDFNEWIGKNVSVDYPRQLHVQPANTRCPSSTSATPSTTRRWRP